MPQKPKHFLSLVLPVYNEEENINIQYEKIVTAMNRINTKYEIIFVDDGSTDSSPEKLKQISVKDKRVKAVFFRKNFGQTAAMAAGIEYSSGDIIAFMDSDLQNDAEDIAKMVDKIDEGYDVVSGWRVNRKDKAITRRLPSKIANALIAKISGVKLHDLGCSLKLYRGEILRQVKLYGEMHRFIPVHTSWVGAKITEVPVNHNPRIYGKSKYGLKRSFKVLLDLITVKFMGSFSTKPIYVFGGTGLILLGLGFCSGIAVILMKVFYQMNMVRNPLLQLTMLLVITAFIFIQMGIMAEIMIRTYHESQGRPPYFVKETINLGKRKL